MYDYSQMNYYPYNMYQNGGYGYQYPVFGKGLNNNLTLNTPQFDVNMYQNYGYRYQYPMHINTPQSNQLVSTPQQNLNVQNLPNTVNFKASEQIQAKSQKEGLSTGAKWAIGIGATIALAVGADFLFCKGKYTKNIIKKFKPDANDIKTKQANTSNTAKPTVPPKAETPQIKIETAKTAEYLKSKTGEKIKKYTSLDEATMDFKVTANKADFEAGKNYEDLLKQLEKHNYSDDKSFIEICSRSKESDYRRMLIDAENHTLYKGTRITPSQSFDPTIKPEFLTPDMPGNYLIKTLADGRRVVGISVPAGRFDGSGRPIRSILNIISKDGEFTPMQKDLIEIISSRSKNVKINSNTTDILSLGIIGNNSYRGLFEVNEEILLSSISTAKKQLKNIDNDFVTKALKGETLEHITNV